MTDHGDGILADPDAAIAQRDAARAELDQARALLLTKSVSKWKHYKTGKTYVVLTVVIRESTQRVEVVYAPLGSSVNFVRPLSEWEEVVRHENKSIARFTRVK